MALFLLPFPVHLVAFETLSSIFPVFLAWHCALVAPVFRCHRETFDTLEAGTCAGSRAWYFSFVFSLVFFFFGEVLNRILTACEEFLF